VANAGPIFTFSLPGDGSCPCPPIRYTIGDICGRGANPASMLGGTISVIFGSQVSLQVHYCRRDEAYFATQLWQNNGRQNGLLSRMLFSELCKFIVNKVPFVGFREGDRLLGSDPDVAYIILLVL